MATKITIRTLLEAGCHFGHQTHRWNPKMKPYIFGERNGMYILDLKQTIINADQAYTFLRNTAKSGKILFVGTKKQAQEAVKNAAERCGMPYINQRWLGGMLTNFVTIRSRINRMEELEGMVADGSMALRGKKEQSVLGKELAKLQANRRWRPRPQGSARCALRHRHQARGERHQGGSPPQYPGHRSARHQLRSRRGHRAGHRHPLQR